MTDCRWHENGCSRCFEKRQ